MMASVSSAGRDSRAFVRVLARRMSQGAICGRVTMRYPPPTSTTASARSSFSYLTRNSSTSARASSASPSSRTSRMRSASSGVSEAKSKASTTSVGVGNGGPSLKVGIDTERTIVPGGVLAALDDDVAEQLGLLRPDAAEPHQLEHGQHRHDDLRPSPLAAGERREQQRPGVAKNGQD